MSKKISLLIIFLFFLFPHTLASEISFDKLPYNYSGTEYYIIKLLPTETISTKNHFTEGQTVQFRIFDDVYVRGKKFLNKDEIINAKIETIILPRYSGLPAELTIDNFEIKNTKKSQFISKYTKQGHYKWWFRVYKLVIPPPISMIPIGRIIKGGHAKITTKDVIIIKYFPEWK